MKLSAAKYEALNPDVYALSFWSWPELTAEQIAAKVGARRLPQSQLRESLAGKIRGMEASDGQPLDLVRTGEADGHYTLVLPSPLRDVDLVNLADLFDPPQPNTAVTEVRGNA